MLPSIALLALVLLGVPSAHAAETADAGAGAVSETNREMIRLFTRHALGSRDFLGAEAALKDHLESDPSDAEALNLLGMTLLQTGRTTEAARQFVAAAKAVKKKDPLRGFFLYNLADAYARGAYVSEAKKTLALVESHPALGLAAKEAQTELRPRQPIPLPRLVPPSRLSVSAAVLTGYDTNVLLVSNSAIAEGEVSGGASPVVTPAVDLRWVSPIRYGDENWVIDARTLYQLNLDETSSEFNSLLMHAGAALAENEPSAPGGFSRQWSAQVDAAFLNSGGFGFYNSVATAGWSGIWRILDRGRVEFRVPLRYQLFAAPASDENDRSGPGLAAGLTYRHRVGSALASIGVNVDYLLAAGSNYVALTSGIPFSIQFADVFWKTGLVLTGNAEAIDFAASEADRSDQRFTLGLGLRRAWGRRVSSGLDYTFQQNASTLDAADYGKQVVSLSLSMEVL